MASRIDWQRLRTSTIVSEVIQCVLALVSLALGWLSFPQLVLLLMVELLLTSVLTSQIYRERGAKRHFLDTLKMLFLCCFCGVFLFASYAAGGFRNGLKIEPIGFAVLAVLVAVRLSILAWQASRSAEPRLVWAREALRRGAVICISFFLACFACFIPGLLVVLLLSPLMPDVAADLGLGAVLLLVHGGLALVMSTMSDKELAEIADQPYLE